MDPIITAIPDVSAYFALCQGVKLHYELYHPTSGNQGKVLVVMGAFATKDHFAGTARHLAENGYEVLMYDHRGVVKSGPARMEQQTSVMLAEDAVALLDYVWGHNTPVHVYGASMGGMVAQELALLLLAQNRLISLGLAVTCRGLKPLGGLLGPIFTPQIVKRVLQAWYWSSKPALVRRLMRLVLSRNLLDMKHPCGETYEEVYFREWMKNFEQHWTFGQGDHTAGACHACVVCTHYLSERSIAVLRDSDVPILCQVAARDHLIPAAMQFELAEKLHAKTVTFDSGHMGLLPWAQRYHNMLLEHFAAGAALRAVAISQASSDWRLLSRSALEQHKLLQSFQAEKALLASQLSSDSTANDQQYRSTAAADLASSSSCTASADVASSSSCTASGDLSLLESAVSDMSLQSSLAELAGAGSVADLAVDVSDWSEDQAVKSEDAELSPAKHRLRHNMLIGAAIDSRTADILTTKNILPFKLKLSVSGMDNLQLP